MPHGVSLELSLRLELHDKRLSSLSGDRSADETAGAIVTDRRVGSDSCGMRPGRIRENRVQVSTLGLILVLSCN